MAASDVLPKLELGCGPNKRIPDAIGIDVQPFHGVDMVGDVFDVLGTFGDSSVGEVHSFHFFEHIADLDRLMAQLARVLVPNGLLRVVVPHFSNAYFYSDPTHRTHFGLYTFCYYARCALFSRTVPPYKAPQFDLISADLVFKASRPFYVRYAIKRVLGLAFNSCAFMQELYEDIFSGLVSCYEVDFRLRRH